MSLFFLNVFISNLHGKEIETTGWLLIKLLEFCFLFSVTSMWWICWLMLSILCANCMMLRKNVLYSNHSGPRLRIQSLSLKMCWKISLCVLPHIIQLKSKLTFWQMWFWNLIGDTLATWPTLNFSASHDPIQRADVDPYERVCVWESERWRESPVVFRTFQTAGIALRSIVLLASLLKITTKNRFVIDLIVFTATSSDLVLFWYGFDGVSFLLNRIYGSWLFLYSPICLIDDI